jgi:hypothetical protein
MKLRTFHRRLALILSPFLILTSLTGIALLFRKNEIYGKPIKELMIGLHNWEIIAPYIGAILSFGLMALTVSGLLIFIKTPKRKF